LTGSSSCPQCETIPATINGPGRLFLWSPLGHTAGKLWQGLSSRGFGCQRREDLGALELALGQGEPARLAEELRCLLSGVELDQTRALYRSGEGDPEPSDFGHVRPLAQWVAEAGSGWLLDMLAEQRLTTHFQPIVEAGDPTRVFAYEGLLRGIHRDGSLVGGGPLFGWGADAGVLFQLDQQARRSAVMAFGPRGAGGSSKLFVNFAPTSIYDPQYCLRTTLRAVEEVGLPPERVVFEVTESENAGSVDNLTDILDFYRDSGFGVALDDLGAGYASLNLLHALQPDYVKLDMDLIRGVDSDPRKAALAGKLLEAAATLGIRSVAEGVETRSEWDWVRSSGADLVQGFLIAHPAPDLIRSGPAL